ncbi:MULTISPECIES: hypothetical protein [Streptomyces]|uniref:hypothetical protein n=1 Tax=Streptomyces TaxID=1883 RepID=UPI001E3241D7|nr:MULTISPECIES: hypothetical protein [Streptomyces]UFQ16974.1 hypothetical protein J2N69_19300 [Streptomyces huasconensis]WCL86576.1 hypothetical protein PPN52_19305 [Streptomyces sp. JCM 35825]
MPAATGAAEWREAAGFPAGETEQALSAFIPYVLGMATSQPPVTRPVVDVTVSYVMQGDGLI